jgi:hypothetical protein
MVPLPALFTPLFTCNLLERGKNQEKLSTKVWYRWCSRNREAGHLEVSPVANPVAPRG